MLKKIHFQYFLPSIALLKRVSIFGVAFCMFAYPLIFYSGTVEAANSANFSMYVGDDPTSKKSVANIWDNHHDDYDDGEWKQLKIFTAKLFGKKNLTLAFDKELTIQIACSGGVAGIADKCESREPVFTTRYYCTLPGKQVTFQKPGNDKEFYEVVYAVGLKDNGQNGAEFTGRDTFNATGGVILTKKYKLTSGGFSEEETAYDLTDHGKSPDDFDDGDNGNENGHDDRFGIDNSDAACRPSPDVVGSMEMKNFDKLSPAEKKKFTPDGTPGSATPEGTDDEDEEEDLCNATGSPLSWIVCPIIDMGAKFTDFVFNDIVRPFLEDVPISSAPGDQGYEAWKQFRLIGNIVLIGSLLAVVYAQTRGDR